MDFDPPKKYLEGERWRNDFVFRDYQGALVDPSTVRFKYKKPSTLETITLVYGVDGALVRDSVGKYHVELSLDDYGVDPALSGTWLYRIESTGSYESAYESKFKVRAKSL